MLARRSFSLILLAFITLTGAVQVAAQDMIYYKASLDADRPFIDYPIKVLQGQTVTIYAEAISTGFDVALSLTNSAGDVVAENDNASLEAGALDALIIYDAPETDTYTARVSATDGEGFFGLTITTEETEELETLTGESVVFEGSITRASATSDHTVTLEAGETVFIQTQVLSGGLDPTLTLFAPDGREVATNDDANLFASNTNAVLIHEVDETGEYTVRVGSYTGAGRFTLSVTRTGVVAGNSQIIRTDITQYVPTRQIPIHVTAGDNVVIFTQSMSGGLDPILTLLDPQGIAILANDDVNTQAGNYNAALSFQAEQTGRYWVRLSSYGNTTGESLVMVAANAAADAVEPILISTQERIEHGEITRAQPSVEFTFDLESGQTVLLETEALSGSLDTILEVIAPNGEVIAQNDDFQSESYNSGIVFTAETSGSYNAVVSSYGATTGEFNLMITIGGEELVALFDNLKRVELSGTVLTRETENFVIHYTLEGEDATTEEYVDAAAAIVEQVWQRQIVEMGWAAPPADAGTGGGDKFDLYLANIFNEADECLYGYASSDWGVGDGDNPNTPVRERNAYTSFLVVDNDYNRVNPIGGGCGGDERPIADLHATIAHEFNHNIQFGYDAAEPHNWLFEAVASWTEIYVAEDDEAATIYVADSFSYPEVCFGSKDGTLIYGHWMFLQSLVDAHGVDIVRQIWEQAVEYDGFEALAAALAPHGDTIEAAMARYYAQNLVRAYPYAERFNATVWRENIIDDTGTWTFTGQGIQELAVNYFDVQLDGTFGTALSGAGRNMQLWAIGIRGDEADVFELGTGGIFDTQGYDHYYLMVFNPVYDEDVEECTYYDYSIQIKPVAGEARPAVRTIDASNFEPIGAGQ